MPKLHRFDLVADLLQCNARCSNTIYELTKSKENLTAEREQLRTQLTNLTGQMEDLQKQYDSVVAGRDQLQEQFDRLDPNSNVTGRKCESLHTFTHVIGSNEERREV